jgi:alpha-beta hydrolase superfamily lysophospholipase
VTSSDGFFQTAGRLRLYERSWQPDHPKAAVVIVHGYAEHSGRYQHLAAVLVARGYAVHAFDLRGHGRSAGPQAFVRSVDEYTEDLAAFLERVRARANGLPLFLLGHSMGGTIVAHYLTSGPPGLRGAVLSAAGLKLKGGLAWIGQLFALLAARFAPRLRGAKLDSRHVSRDPAVVAAYDADPLVYRGGMRAATAAALIRAIRTIRKRADTISLPVVLLHGTADRLTEPSGSADLHKRAASADKTLKLYPGLYHEILNEPEREQVIADILAWLDARVGQDSPPRGQAAG